MGLKKQKQLHGETIHVDVLVKRAAAARMLGVSLVTLDRWRSDGRIKALKLGGGVRFRVRDIAEILQKGC